MSRIRTIKPAFWSSATLGRVSRDARLTFIGLWNEADDFGRLLGSAKRLAGIVFPHDEDVTAATIEGWLGQLAFEGLILRYTVAGVAYIHVRGMNEHQKIDRRWPSQFPPPPDHTPQTASERLTDFSPMTGEGTASLTETPPIDRGDSPNDPRVSVSLGEKSAPEVGSRRSEVGSRKVEGSAEGEAPTAADVPPVADAPAPPTKAKKPKTPIDQTHKDKADALAWEALMRMPYDGQHPPKSENPPQAWEWFRDEFKAFDGQNGRVSFKVALSKPREWFKNAPKSKRWKTPEGVHVWLSKDYGSARVSYEQDRRGVQGAGNRTPTRGAPTGEGRRKIPDYDKHGGRIDLPPAYVWNEADFHAFDQGYAWRDGKWRTAAREDQQEPPTSSTPLEPAPPTEDAAADDPDPQAVLEAMRHRFRPGTRTIADPASIAGTYAKPIAGRAAGPPGAHVVQIHAAPSATDPPTTRTENMDQGRGADHADG